MPAGMKHLRTVEGVREYVVTDRRLRQKLFKDGEIDAYYDAGAIYYRTMKLANDVRIRRHEFQHARQERFFGRPIFEALYWWTSSVLGYRLCPFEVQARCRE